MLVIVAILALGFGWIASILPKPDFVERDRLTRLHMAQSEWWSGQAERGAAGSRSTFLERADWHARRARQLRGMLLFDQRAEQGYDRERDVEEERLIDALNVQLDRQLDKVREQIARQQMRRNGRPTPR